MSDSLSAKNGRFLGVRLSSEEEAALERFRAEHQLPHRSAAVRALLATEPPSGAGSVELPVTVRRELEELVEDGYFTSVPAAVEHAVQLALRELVATHGEGFRELRRHARELGERRARQRRADREGRGLLRR